MKGCGHELNYETMGSMPVCRDCGLTYFEIDDHPAIRCADARCYRASGLLPDRKSGDIWTLDADGIGRNDRARALVRLQNRGIAVADQDDKTAETCKAKFNNGTINFSVPPLVPPFPIIPPATAAPLPLNALRAPTVQAIGLRVTR